MSLDDVERRAVSTLTVSFLIWLAIDCSGDACVDVGRDAARFPPGSGAAGWDPIWPLGPEVPREGTDMSFLTVCLDRGAKEGDHHPAPKLHWTRRQLSHHMAMPQRWLVDNSRCTTGTQA